jgi:hypothetical protein
MTTSSILHEVADRHRIKSLQFAADDVLATANAKMRRVADVLKAVAMQDYQHVVVVVHTSTGVEKIQTKIVAAGDDFVVTDSGYSLPMGCIEKIEFPVL